MNVKAKALSYQNDKIIKRFIKHHPYIPVEDASLIFEECKKWLYLCHISDERKIAPFISPELVLIDEMWHNFILFTKEYSEYCLESFGYYMHHAPNVSEEATDMPRYENQLKQQMEFIFDEFGNETLILWYDTFPSMYDKWANSK